MAGDLVCYFRSVYYSVGYLKMLKNFTFDGLLTASKFYSLNLPRLFHSSKTVGKLEHWKSYNDKIYPPQSPDEPRRPAYVVHCKEDIKYSYKKLWYIASLVRGMTVDEALKQLSFIQKKGAVAVKETILEAQKKAVNEHNVEFKSNLWVSESFVGKGMVVKGLRRGARGRITYIRYKYTHYFVTLEEGSPPEYYYHFRKPKSGGELLEEYLTKLRNRKIINSL